LCLLILTYTQHRQFTRFRTTLEFNHIYLESGMSYRQMENGIYNNDRFHVERSKLGEYEFTSNKVLLSHFEPPKFNIVLALHVYDNAVAFGPRDFAANEISIP